MKLKLRRKHLVFAFAILLGVLLIAWELFQLLPSVRLQYLHLANRIGASDTLVQFFDDDDKQVRSDACGAMIAGGSKSIPALMKGVGGKSAKIRRLSIFTLGQIGAPAKESIPLLMARLKSDVQEKLEPKEAIRAWCATAIGKIGAGDPDLLAEFTSWLKSDDREFRALALAALSRWPRDAVKPTPG